MGVKMDRFGNETMTVALYDKKQSGFPKGIVTIAGKSFKVEAWPAGQNVTANKKGDTPHAFVKLTLLKPMSNSGTFGRGSKKW